MSVQKPKSYTCTLTLSPDCLSLTGPVTGSVASPCPDGWGLETTQICSISRVLPMVRAALRREHRAGDWGEVPELGQYGECMAMATHVLLFFR
jgi:hypothetical protein